LSVCFILYIIQTYLSVDELHVSGALRIAVASTVLGTSLVGGETGHATVCVHGREVDGTVETTRELGNVDVEGELLVQELEHLVFGVAVEEVDSGTDVLSVGVALDELESQGIAAGRDSISSGVVSPLESAVGGTNGVAGTDGCVPGVSYKNIW